MASNHPDEDAYGSYDTYGGGQQPWEEWNPTEESVRPVKGRHRVARQRGFARGSTVLGVGVIAAVGAGGVATAQGKAPVHIAMPDLSSVTDSLSDADSLPGVGALISDAESGSHSGAGSGGQAASSPLTSAGVTKADAAQGRTDAGEALRARIMQQADSQEDAADTAARKAAEEAAAKKAAEQAAAEQKAAEAEAARKAEAARLAKLRESYKLPVASYTITGTFGQPGSLWSSGYHTGLDFAAPTGTPIHAIHSGTVTEAGWAGAYGYRTILTLDDGTELWFCHQSSINVGVGRKVTTGDVIGRVGATGNVTGPHLHLEVHPDGQATAVDPAPWLRDKGLTP
ncbi:M23 family metallopeptidase [Streptomyces beihaiensis]|uniref:M23 family metallopeptidase n=1 Tax=Streptomyces beihaiensis TaxID=2984495 RepID=A0ABT3U397_9ACTN|nr:M23 family metallopeptidase [Streptomyces beihaiensis]MCX3062725.1 M23 family metallopeptidase [Streptomyces beihaiensis]